MTHPHRNDINTDLEAWSKPISYTRTHEKEYYDLAIPIYATSYDQNLRPNRIRRIINVAKTYVNEHVIVPIFRAETKAKNVWRSEFESRAAYLALTFSACTLFRFPFVCVRSGGGLFFFVYVLIVIFVMQPVMFTLMIVGRMQRPGLVKYPLLYLFSKGIPLVMLYMCLVFITNNNVVLGYSGVYFLAQLVDSPPDVCTVRMKGGSSECTPYKDINPVIPRPTTPAIVLSTTSHLSTDLFFRYYIQGDKWRQGKFFYFSPREWRFFFGMIVVFILVLLAAYKSIVSPLSRILIYGSFLIPTCLIALLIFQLSFDGGAGGLSYYLLVFHWRELLTIEFWSDAWSYAIFSCLPGYGFISAYSNYKTTVRGVYVLSWMICLSVIVFSGLAFCLAATEMGILENVANIKSYFSVISEKAALSYVCLTNVFMKMDSVWPSIIFFGYVTIFGLWTQVVAMELCFYYLVDFSNDFFPTVQLSSNHRLQLFLGIILVELFLLTAYGTSVGPFVFEATFIFSGSWVACLLCILRVYVSTRYYGYDIFEVKVEVMLDKSPPRYFEIQIRYIVLPLLGLGLLLMSIHIFGEPYLSRPRDHSLTTTSASLIYGKLLNLVPMLYLLGKFFYFGGCKRNKVGASRFSFSNKFLGSRSNIIAGGSRLNKRRGAVFVPNASWGKASIFAMLYQTKVESQDEAYVFHRMQKLQKKELEDLHQDKKVAWETGPVKRALISSELLKNVPDAASYFHTKNAKDIVLKDMVYLDRILRNYSIENLFVALLASDELDLDDEDDLRVTLMTNLLLGQKDLNRTLPTRPSSRPKIISVLDDPRELVYTDKLLAYFYTDHIKQELGPPYSTGCDWQCLFDIKREIVSKIPRHDWKELVEYVVKFRVKGKHDNIIHILLIEGKNHPVLSRLPKPSPIIVELNYKALKSDKHPKDKYQTVVGKTLTHLYHHHKYFFAEMSVADLQAVDITPNMYKTKIERHIGISDYEFLDPKQVVICVIELEEDEQRVELEKQFISPLSNSGWLLKPTRRRLKQEDTIVKIEEILDDMNATRIPGEPTLTYMKVEMEKGELSALEDKLMRTPLDIVFEERMEPLHYDTSSSSSDSFIHTITASSTRLQDADDKDYAETLVQVSEDDEEFRNFVTFVGHWKKRDDGKADDPKAALRAGRREVSKTLDLYDIRAQLHNLFDVGDMSMRKIKDGVPPPSVDFSRISIPENFARVQMPDKSSYSHHVPVETMETASVVTLWSRVSSMIDKGDLDPVGLRRVDDSQKPVSRAENINNDSRYNYLVTAPKTLQVERKDYENIIMSNSNDSISSKHHKSGYRDLFNIFEPS